MNRSQRRRKETFQHTTWIQNKIKMSIIMVKKHYMLLHMQNTLQYFLFLFLAYCVDLIFCICPPTFIHIPFSVLKCLKRHTNLWIKTWHNFNVIYQCWNWRPKHKKKYNVLLWRFLYFWFFFFSVTLICNFIWVPMKPSQFLFSIFTSFNQLTWSAHRAKTK